MGQALKHPRKQFMLCDEAGGSNKLPVPLAGHTADLTGARIDRLCFSQKPVNGSALPCVGLWLRSYVQRTS